MFLRAKHWQLFTLFLMLFLIEEFALRRNATMAGSSVPLVRVLTALDILIFVVWLCCWLISQFRIGNVAQARPSLPPSLPPSLG
jgi:hypothetical protein